MEVNLTDYLTPVEGKKCLASYKLNLPLVRSVPPITHFPHFSQVELLGCLSMLLEQLPSVSPSDLGTCMGVAEDLAGRWGQDVQV